MTGGKKGLYISSTLSEKIKGIICFKYIVWKNYQNWNKLVSESQEEFILFNLIVWQSDWSLVDPLPYDHFFLSLNPRILEYVEVEYFPWVSQYQHISGRKMTAIIINLIGWEWIKIGETSWPKYVAKLTQAVSACCTLICCWKITRQIAGIPNSYDMLLLTHEQYNDVRYTWINSTYSSNEIDTHG